MTSHELATQLLNGPDLPIFHVDPSLGNYGNGEHSATRPVIEIEEGQVLDSFTEEEIYQRFISINGSGDLSVEDNGLEIT